MHANNPNFQSTMGSEEGPSFNDIFLINTHYKCFGKDLGCFKIRTNELGAPKITQWVITQITHGWYHPSPNHHPVGDGW
jgi:hypothetical protein